MKKNYIKILSISFLFFLTILYCNNFQLYCQKPELVVQTGHSDAVRTVAFSSDGQYVASGSADNTIKIWNVTTGKEIRTLSGHTKKINAVAFHPKQDILASCSDDNSIKIWDILTGSEIITLKGKSDVILLGIYTIAFSPDGKMLASGGSDNIVSIWDWSTGKCIQYLSGHTSDNYSGGIFSLDYSSDGNFLASGGKGNDVIVWDAASYKKIFTFDSHGGSIYSVSFSFDNKILASASEDNKIRFWNLTDGNEVISLSDFSQKGNYVLFSPTENIFASWSESNIVSIIDYKTHKIIKTISALTGVVNTVAFSPDGELLATGSEYNTAAIWDLSKGNMLFLLKGYSSIVNSIKFSPFDNILVIGTRDNTVKFWDLIAGKLIKTIPGYTAFSSIAISPNGKRILIADEIWDMERKVKLATLPEASIVASVAYSPDGKYFAVGAINNIIKVFEQSSGKELLRLTGITLATTLAFSPDGKCLASGSDDNILRIWNLETGSETQRFLGHTGSINSVAFHPNKNIIASASSDRTIKIFDIESGRELKTLTGHTGIVNSVAFDRYGMFLASGSWDKTVKLWDMDSGKEIFSYRHSSLVNSVAFSPDGKFLASGGNDCRTKLWNIKENKEAATLISLGENDWAVVSPDGRFDASQNGMLLLHYVQNSQPIPLDAFFEQYFTPQLLHEIILGKLEPVKNPVVDFTKEIKLPPAITIISPTDSLFKQENVRIKISLTDQGGGIDEVRLYQNGKLIDEENFGLLAKENNKLEKIFNVFLVPGKNDFRITSFNTARTELSESFTLELDQNTPTTNLFIISVGINNYKNSSYNLGFSQPDAEAFAKCVYERGSGIFKNIYLYEIYNNNATKENIESVFKKIIAEAKPLDTFIFYYAGHGVMLEDADGNPEDFYLVMHDITQMYGNEELVRQKGVSAKMLKEMSRMVKSQKQLLILDACYSGGAVEEFKYRGLPEQKAIMQLGRSAGIVIIASAGTEQRAAELANFGHGIFTFALIRGLEGDADGGKLDGKITVNELVAYINDQVPELTLKYTGRRQDPSCIVVGQDFPIVIVK